MTEHEHYQADLKAYQDNELPFLRRLAVRRHVATCPACREELMQMTQVTENLRADEPRVNGEAPQLEAAMKCKIVEAYEPAIKHEVTNSRQIVKYMPIIGTTATIALLATVFLPIFRAHKASYAPASPQSVKAIGIAISQYAQEMDEQLPTGAHHGLYPSPPVGPTAVDDFTRRVHKEATIAVEVDDPEAKGDDIEGTVKGEGGFVASNSLTTGDDGRKTAVMSLKVPVAQFETILRHVAHLGDVKEKNVTGEDITEQVSDAGQKENVLEDEVNRADARLQQLGKKAKWDDAETARDLRIQLAQSRARLVLLKKLGELSEIDVTLTQKSKPVQPPASGFVSGMSDTTQSAFGSLLGAVSALLTVVIWIVVYAPIWIPAGLFARWLYRRLRTASEPTGVSS